LADKKAKIDLTVIITLSGPFVFGKPPFSAKMTAGLLCKKKQPQLLDD